MCPNYHYYSITQVVLRDHKNVSRYLHYGQIPPTGINAQLSQIMTIPIQIPLLKNWSKEGIWGNLRLYFFLH